MSGAERARRYRQRLAQLGKQGTLISRQGFQWPRAAMAAFAKSGGGNSPRAIGEAAGAFNRARS